MLLVLSGLPGSGKSELARALAERYPFCLVGSDAVRRAIFPQRNYTGPEHAATYRTCHEVIGYLLRSNVWTVFDATNPSRRDRREALELGRAAGARAYAVQLQVSADTALRRLRIREEGGDPYGSEAGIGVFEAMNATFQVEEARGPFALDAERDLKTLVEDVARILEDDPRAGL